MAEDVPVSFRARHPVSRRLHRIRLRVGERATSAVSDGFFRSLSALGRLHPASRPRRHNVERIENINYLKNGGDDHRLDIYRPLQRPGPYPVVLYVHGGGFRVLSKDTHWVMGLAFARFGYLVCNISYRLAPRHPYPAAIADTCAAYRWVVRNVAAYGGDPSRIVVAGESAGANLVTALTLATCFERPEPWARLAYDTGISPAVTIPFCGLLEVSNPERFAERRPMPLWLSSIINHCSDAYLRDVAHTSDVDRVFGPNYLDLANPLTTLERAQRDRVAPARPLPPFFVPVGTKDPLLDDTRRLERVLTAMGVTCQASYYPGEIHAFHALVWRRQARRAWRDVLAFLDRHLPRR